MCIYCDLKKSGEERELAVLHIKLQISRLTDLAGLYHLILCEKLQPHTKDMQKVCLLERAILRQLAQNI